MSKNLNDGLYDQKDLLKHEKITLQCEDRDWVPQCKNC